MSPNKRTVMLSLVKVRRAYGQVALNPVVLRPPVNAYLPIYAILFLGLSPGLISTAVWSEKDAQELSALAVERDLASTTHK